MRTLVLRLLARMREGSLTVVEGGRRTELGSGAPHATIDIHSPRFWRALLRGSRGLAESYADGQWDSPDLTALIRLAARNAAQLDAPRRRLSPLREPYQRLRAVRNTPRRSRQDIAAHYDLGNELFELMLDPTMMYSSARFTRPHMTLEEASIAKLDLVCDKLDARARRPRARDRDRLGRLRDPRRRHPRLPRDHHHALAGTARARARARARGRPRGSRHRPRPRLPRARGPLRQARLDRDDRGGRLEGLRDLLRALLGPARAQRRDAAPGDHHRRPRLRRRARVEELHPHAHLPQRLPAVGRGHRALPRAPHRPAPHPLRGLRARLRRDAAALAREPRQPSGSRRSATTSASGACGGCTCATARRASPSGGSGSRRRCWPSRAGPLSGSACRAR